MTFAMAVLAAQTQSEETCSVVPISRLQQRLQQPLQARGVSLA